MPFILRAVESGLGGAIVEEGVCVCVCVCVHALEKFDNPLILMPICDHDQMEWWLQWINILTVF